MEHDWPPQDPDYEPAPRRTRKPVPDQDRQLDEPPTPPLLRMGFETKAPQAQASLGDDLWELHSAAGKIAEFTDAGTFEDFTQSEVLRAVTASMLGIMADALTRIAKLSPEQATKLDATNFLTLHTRLTTGEPVPDRELWDFVRNALPALHARATTELEAWHSA